MKKYKAVISLGILIITIFACDQNNPTTQSAVPIQQKERWGIYTLDLNTQVIELIFSAPHEITNLRLNSAMDRFVFSQRVDGNTLDDNEIFSLGVDGNNLQRLTNNKFQDTYPAWSPDGTEIAYLAMPYNSMDIYKMTTDGRHPRQFYDSGNHDADIDWVNNQIAFTRNSQIWVMNADGSEPRQLTDPPRAGDWGNANLPFGDYDPRISPDGSKVVFERLTDDKSHHGNYDLYVIDIDGTNLRNLTDTGYTQGLAYWSPSGNQIAYIVSAIDDVGQYDIYIMNSDGTENRNVTPTSFPPQFIVHWVIFAGKDSQLYLICEWWSDK